MREIRKVLAVAEAHTRTVFAYPGAEILRSIFLIVILVVFLSLWTTTYGALGTHEMAGLTLPGMMEYLVATEAIILATPRPGAQITEDVRTGALSIHLIRPMSYLAFQFGVAIGEAWPRILLNLVVGSLLVIVTQGTLPITLLGLVAFIPVGILAFFLSTACYLLIAIMAFWIEDSWALTFIFSRLVMILGGLLIPLSLFPPALAKLAQFLPLALMVYGPANTLVHFSGGAYGTLLIRQTLWLVAILVILIAVYRRGVRALHVHGG